MWVLGVFSIRGKGLCRWGLLRAISLSRYLYIYIYIHIHVCVHICIYKYGCIYVYVYVYLCMSTSIHRASERDRERERDTAGACTRAEILEFLVTSLERCCLRYPPPENPYKDLTLGVQVSKCDVDIAIQNYRAYYSNYR